MLILVILGASGRVTNDRKKKQTRLNTTAMVLSMLITILNIAITSFNGNASSLRNNYTGGVGKFGDGANDLEI